jgi:hypothetical protein
MTELACFILEKPSTQRSTSTVVSRNQMNKNSNGAKNGKPNNKVMSRSRSYSTRSRSRSRSSRSSRSRSRSNSSRSRSRSSSRSSYAKNNVIIKKQPPPPSIGTKKTNHQQAVNHSYVINTTRGNNKTDSKISKASSGGLYPSKEEISLLSCNSSWLLNYFNGFLLLKPRRIEETSPNQTQISRAEAMRAAIGHRLNS